MIKDQPEIQGMKMPTASKLYKVARFYPKTYDFSATLKSELGGNYKNDPFDLIVAYGQDKRTFIEAFTALHYDSIPDDYFRITKKTRGFPYVDTVEINL